MTQRLGDRWYAASSVADVFFSSIHSCLMQGALTRLPRRASSEYSAGTLGLRDTNAPSVLSHCLDASSCSPQCSGYHIAELERPSRVAYLVHCRARARSGALRTLARLECSVELLGDTVGGAAGVYFCERSYPLDLGFAVQFWRDPFIDCFTHEVVFFGGSYRVLPGASEAAEFIFRHLGRATLLGEPLARGTRAPAGGGEDGWGNPPSE